jgi:endonuclease YncB( thermonuclease family)
MRGWIVVAVLAFSAPASAQAPETGPCSLAAAQPATVVRVEEDFSLRLDDGRRVHLVGLDFPSGDATTRDAALTRLIAWLDGAAVFVETFAATADRWGRLPAQIVTPAGEEPQAPLASVGATLIGEGLARFRPDAAATPCAPAYLAAERAPRERGLGLWAREPEIDASSEAPAMLDELARRRGMVVIAGTIRSVGETASAYYLNFAAKRREGLAIVIFRRNLAIFASHGLVPRTLMGRRVRVRGLIETQHGPRVEISTPLEIELLDDPPAR